MSSTPDETKRFVKKYGDIVVRVHQILKERNLSQKDLAEMMNKTPSEISKWLSGDHNFTLRSLTKLEAELGVDIIYVPQRDSFHVQISSTIKATAAKAEPVSTKMTFLDARATTPPSEGSVAA